MKKLITTLLFVITTGVCLSVIMFVIWNIEFNTQRKEKMEITDQVVLDRADELVQEVLNISKTISSVEKAKIKLKELFVRSLTQADSEKVTTVLSAITEHIASFCDECGKERVLTNCGNLWKCGPCINTNKQ